MSTSVNQVQSREQANSMVAAHKLTKKSREVMENEARAAIANSKLLTEDQVSALEVCETLVTQDYVIFLISDTTDSVPVGVLWAYAEKLRDGSGFLLSHGTGNSQDGMAIRACSKLALGAGSKAARYEYGGDLNDVNGQISVNHQLSSEQFASQLTEIVFVDGGGRKRISLSSTEDRLEEITSQADQTAPAPAPAPAEVAKPPLQADDDFPEDPTGSDDDGG